jgi:hypothetical protein
MEITLVVHLVGVILVMIARTMKSLRQKEVKEVVMKFIMMVLTIRFVAELITGKRKVVRNDVSAGDQKVIHPAEFNTR